MKDYVLDIKTGTYNPHNISRCRANMSLYFERILLFTLLKIFDICSESRFEKDYSTNVYKNMYIWIYITFCVVYFLLSI